MPTAIDNILLQAQLAKRISTQRFMELVAGLSTIAPSSMMQYPREYLSAVANIVASDTRDLVDPDAHPDANAKTKRGLLMDYLREGRNVTNFCDVEFMTNITTLIVNVQHVWLALAKEDPRKRLFELAREFPELVLPESFEMKHYFKPDAGRIHPDHITIICAAVQSPYEAQRERFKPSSTIHKILQ